MRPFSERESPPVTSSLFRRPATPPEPSGWYAVAALGGVSAGLGMLAIAASLLSFSLSPLTWYLTRAAGITLYLLLWLSVLLGLGITTKLFDRFGGRGVIYSTHLFATQLAYGFLALHLLTLLADSHAPFGLRDLLIPFRSPGAEPWTGLGVLALYLFVVVAASFGARRMIDYRVWKALHLLAFPLFGLALAHGLGSGSDTGTLWMDALYLLTALPVLCLTLYRVLRGPARARPPALAAGEGVKPHERFGSPVQAARLARHANHARSAR